MMLALFVILSSCSALDDSAAFEYNIAESATTTILFPWFVVTVGVIVSFVLTRFEVPIPSAAVMFIIGTFMRLAAVFQVRHINDLSELDQLSTSVVQWSNIKSAVLLLVFLPGLIFRDAIEVNFNVFCRALPQLLLLAFPMVLVGTVLTAVVGYYLNPYQFSWSLAATLGAILASTDPVAVGSVLKKAGAPPRLQMHIGGESLLNDGSAVVFFSVFSRIYLSELGFAEPVGLGEGFLIFFRMSLGGVAVGLAFATGLLFLLYKLDQRLEPEYNVLQVVAALSTAFLSYYVSEQVCDMSGVIACVTCGIAARALGRGLIRDNRLMDSYLQLMEYLLNTLLFALGGVVWGEVIAERNTISIDREDWMYLIVLYIMVMIIRFIQVGLFFPVFSRVGLGSDWKEAIFLSFGGIRGAVGCALALSLSRSAREASYDSDDLKSTEALEFLAGGVTLLTLFVNGSMAGPVLKALGLTKPPMSRKRALRIFRASAEAFVQEEYLKIQAERRFEKIKFSAIKAHVPFALQEPNQSPRSKHHRRKSSVYDVECDSEPAQRLLQASERSEPDTAVVDMRLVFLEFLKEAYSSELKNGELDEREDNGLTIDVLQQSVGQALVDAGHNECLQDWEYANGPDVSEDAKSFLSRKIRQWTGQSRSSNCCSFQYQKDRILLLRALSFIEAHRIADKKLQSLVNSIISSESNLSTSYNSVALTRAVEIISEESQEQSEYARSVILNHPKAQNIISHHACTIILRRLASFIEQNCEDGILTKKEAKMYLAKIDRNIEVSKTCDRECPEVARTNGSSESVTAL